MKSGVGSVVCFILQMGEIGEGGVGERAFLKGGEINIQVRDCDGMLSKVRFRVSRSKR